MATPLNPISIRAIGVNGLIRQAAVDDVLIPDGAVTESINFQFDRVGAATVRMGVAGLGSTVLTSRPCFGLHNAQQGTALAVFSNGSSATIYSFSAGAWSMSLDGGTASVAIRFLDFGSYTIALNFMYNTYTSIRFWNAGSSRHWHVSGNPLNTDQMYGRACQLGEVYKSRIYLGGDTSKEGNPSRLYFSNTIATDGTVSWDKSVNFVDINPGDGEGMTGLKRFSLELLVFKPNYIYRFRTSGVDPDPLIKIGTRSNESIVEGKRGCYFHHDTGFYRYTGGYPEEISRPISDIVAAIPYSKFSTIAGWNDQNHIYWSLGNISVAESKETVTIKNCVVRYTESSDVWTVYSYAFEPRRGMTYNNGTTITRIVGSDMGNVGTLDSGNLDFEAPIKYRLRTKWYEIEGIVTTKVIQDLAAICEKAQASELMYQVDEKTQYETIGELKQLVTYFNNKAIKCKRIRFLITGVSRFDSPVFQGIEILGGINEGIVR